MRLVFGLVLVLGLGLAGFAVYMANGYVSNYESELAAANAAKAKNVELVAVFVTNRQIKYGEQIFKKDVRIVAWPKDAIPEGAYHEGEVLFPDGEKVLRTSLRLMEKDEAVLAVKVSEPGEDAGLTSRLAKGMRAFAIKVDVTSGVSGFLRPDDIVDVYWTGRSGGGDEGFTKLIQEKVRLIAIDQIANGDNSNPMIARTVTVEATPQQVASLAQAQSTGRLSLALVGIEDDIVTGSIEVNQNDLLGIEKQIAVEVTAEKVCSIKTRRGAEVVEIPIPCTN